MITPGKIVTLPIFRIDEDGCWLGTETSEVRLYPEDFNEVSVVGDELEVFICFDEKIKLSATTMLPFITLNKAGVSRVSGVGTAGAFVDIGSKRDILIPNEEQNRPLESGDKVVFVLKYNDQSRRLYGSTYVSRYFKNNIWDKKLGDPVNVRVSEKTQFGRKVVVEDSGMGVIFRNDIMRPLRLGDTMIMYIKEFKERDLVLSMQKSGVDLIEETMERIMDLLAQHNGYLRLTNDSDPEEVKLRLRVSKNTFKRAAGVLSDDGKIVLTKRGIKLKKD